MLAFSLALVLSGCQTAPKKDNQPTPWEYSS